MESRTEMVSLPADEAGELLEDPPKPVSSRRTNYLIGIGLLLVVVLLWTSSNFITQALFDGGYHKPFLVTYLNTSSFILYLFPFLVKYLWRKRSDEGVTLRETRGDYEALSTSENAVLENPPLYTARSPYVPTDVPVADAVDPAQLPPLTTRETAHLASIFCFFWFIANWTVNASLDYTSVASATILSSTSGFFTLAIGRLFAVESLTAVKIAAVITSFIGVLLVSLSDSSSKSPAASDPGSVTLSLNALLQPRVDTNPILGDLLALMAALFYALYVILLKVRIHSESRIDMQLFFGFVGLFNVMALFPVGVILHFTGSEPFELPSTGKSWGAVLINMLITFSSDYIYVIAMLKTTPLIVTIGLSLTIPLAVVGDEVLNKPTQAQAALGALLVLGAFGLVGWADTNSRPQKLAREDVIARIDTPQEESLDAGDSRRREVVV